MFDHIFSFRAVQLHTNMVCKPMDSLRYSWLTICQVSVVRGGMEVRLLALMSSNNY